MVSTRTPESGSHGARPPYVLSLFVAGMTARSAQAVDNIRALCEQHLHGAYDLEVINLYEQPGLAVTQQIVAAPTCVRRSPLPARRVIGDMSNTARVLSGLDLEAKA